MSEPIRIFVGTSARDKPAEMVLEYTLRRYTTAELDIHWMRAGDPGFDDWKCVFDLNPETTAHRWQGPAFSMFRFAIPELCGFEGKAIYLDSDTLVREDIGELWDWPQVGAVLCCPSQRLCVSKWDCRQFQVPWWPSLQAMKAWEQATATLTPLRQLMREHGFFDETLDPQWNCVDGHGFDEKLTRLVHYSNTKTQPWKPWPEKRRYFPHKSKAMERLWHDTFAKAKRAAKDAKRQAMS